MTIELFRENSYLKECEATIVNINDRGGIILDKTVFYPTGGGQPGDSGILETSRGSIQIATTVKDKETGEIIHVPGEAQPVPSINDNIKAKLDWERRYQHMRMHTALHLLCAAVPCGVTGGQINQTKSRLDFDIGEFTLDKEKISENINQLIGDSHPVSYYWISDEELAQNPELVRTMSVQPPSGSGKVRLMKIGEGVDLQPCGGTHVNNTSEIGRVKVAKIENKGKRNRRVNIVFESE